jgi:hypothetical protein
MRIAIREQLAAVVVLAVGVALTIVSVPTWIFVVSQIRVSSSPLRAPVAPCGSRDLQGSRFPPHPDAPTRKEITDIVGQNSFVVNVESDGLSLTASLKAARISSGSVKIRALSAPLRLSEAPDTPI